MLGVSLYNAGLPMWACFLGAVVAVALISVGMEEVAIRPLMKKGSSRRSSRRWAPPCARDGGDAHLGTRR
jgi:hypothetical protein